MITIIDEAAKIRAFLPKVTAIVGGGIVTVEDVAVVHYVGEADPGDTASGPDDLASPER
jgi:hypothetical protein